MSGMVRKLRSIATSLLLIVVVALGARLAFAWDQARKIPREALATAPFEQETGSIAHSLVAGKGVSNPFLKDTWPTAWLTPVYPLLVAATFQVFGVFTLPSFFFLVLVNSLFSASVCVPVYYAGQRIAGQGAGSTAAWLWALFPSAVMMPFEWIWDTSMAAFLVAALLWATLELPDLEPQLTVDWLLYGGLWGFALMVNPSMGALLPFFLGWAAYRAKRWELGTSKPTPVPGAHPRTLRRAALALGVTIVCCIPWTIRNYAVFHRFVPLRSNFPLELYIGNNENYDDKRPRWPPPITKERETVRYFRLGETAFMDEEMRKAMNFFVSHPRVELTLFGERLIAFWAGIANPMTVFLTADSVLIRSLILTAGFTGISALIGIVVLIRRSMYALPIASYPLVFPSLYYVTH